MMLWIFIPFVLILAGIIAYATDVIAKKAGRAHIRWFGLRPRQTATLVAVLSGVGISAASLGAFVLMNRNAIATIAQADQLRPQIEKLRHELDDVQRDLSQVQRERDQAQTEAIRLSKAQTAALAQLKETNTSLKISQQDKRRAENQRTQLQIKVSELSHLRDNLEAQSVEIRHQLQQAEAENTASEKRAHELDARLLRLSQRNTQAESQAAIAQQKAATATQRLEALQSQISTLRSAALDATNKANQAQQESQQALKARNEAQYQRDNLLKQQTQLSAQIKQAQQERDRALREKEDIEENLTRLRHQQNQLQQSNAAIARQLDSTRATLSQLRDDYSTTRTELIASRNIELSYQKNAVVYAGVVPSVRNLDDFLTFASRAAEAQGARGNDEGSAARLSPSGRSALENKLRGLNTSSFVFCRAIQNSASGFPVNLTCDARPNSVLYKAGQSIRQKTIDPNSPLQSQIADLVQDAVLQLTSRGVPSSYIDHQGLEVTEFASLLAQLSNRKEKTVVHIAPRQDVKPSTRVTLYATF